MGKLDAKPEDFVSSKEVMAALGISRTTLNRYLGASQFPAPLKLPGRRRWLRTDVNRYLADARAA